MVRCACGVHNLGVYEKDGRYYFNNCNHPIPDGKVVVRQERAAMPCSNFKNPGAMGRTSK